MTPILQLLRIKDEETNLESRKNITFPTGENNPSDSGFQKPQRHKEGMAHLAKCRKEKTKQNTKPPKSQTSNKQNSHLTQKEKTYSNPKPTKRALRSKDE